MDIKDVCLWIVIAELSSAVLALVAAPWIVLYKKHKAQPLMIVGQETQSEEVQREVKRRKKRIRCQSCNYALSSTPDCVTVELDNTVGKFTCVRCSHENKVQM